MNTDKQRAAFEVWMRKEHQEHSLEYVNGRYTYSPPQRLWEAYQAAITSSEVQALRDALKAMMDYAGQPISHPAAQLARAALSQEQGEKHDN